MSLANLASYESKIDSPYQIITETKDSIGTNFNGIWYSLWRAGPLAPSIPSTAEALTRTSPGAMGQINASTVQRLARVICRTGNPLTLVLADRLSHMGGLVGNVTTSQTVNTAALTRYTSGVGVWAAMEIYSTVGTTISQGPTLDYTNSAGTTGRTSLAANLGGTANREVGRLIQCPVAVGDVGVRAVASVTNSVSTGTAGNFGITLFKPLWKATFTDGYNDVFEWDAVRQKGLSMPVIESDACLQWMVISGTSSTGVLNIITKFIEE